MSENALALGREFYGNERFSMMEKVFERAGIKLGAPGTEKFLKMFITNADALKQFAEEKGYHFGDKTFMTGGNRDFHAKLGQFGHDILDSLVPLTGKELEGDLYLRDKRARDLATGIIQTLVVKEGTEDYVGWRKTLLGKHNGKSDLFGTRLE